MHKTKSFLAIIFLVGFIVIAAFISAISVVAERSHTLAQVREIDYQIIAALLAAANPGESESIGTKLVQDAFDKLKAHESPVPRIGLLLEKDGVIKASSLNKKSANDIREKYGLSADAITRTELGNGWILTGILIDRKYDFNSWHSFLSVPYEQLLDERGVSLELIFRKAKLPFFALILTGFTLLGIWFFWWRFSLRKIHNLEKEVSHALFAIENTESELKIARIESERRRDKALKLGESLSKSELERHQVWQEYLDADSKVNQLETKLSETQEKLAERDEELVNTEGVSKKGNRLLRGIWKLEWHPDALKDANSFFSRSAQPAVKRHLRELLDKISKIQGKPDKEWSPFKIREDVWVWHNGGRQQAKVYWAILNGEISVIAVDTGKDSHQKFDGGKILKSRVDGMTNSIRLKKAA